jgi:CrcB protein
MRSFPNRRVVAADGFWRRSDPRDKESVRVPEPAASSAAFPPGLASTGPVPEDAGGASRPAQWRLVRPRADRRTVAAIFAGGALGTLARAALAEAFPHAATAWPWPTFAVNIGAAFLLGYFVTRLQERLPLSSYRRPLLGTGVCGGLSTFSTMEVEILKMLSAHAYGLAAGYAAASIAAGFAALHLATALVRRVPVVEKPVRP